VLDLRAGWSERCIVCTSLRSVAETDLPPEN